MNHRVVVAVIAAVLTATFPAQAADLTAPPAPPPIVGGLTTPQGWPGAPDVSADAYLLTNLDTGQVLAAKAADQRRPVASTVKVMTAWTALRRTSLGAAIRAGGEVAPTRSDGARVGLDPGDTWTVEDLLEAVVARSGNDAARALAVGVAGTTAGFVELMRQDAAALGLHGVVLHTPDGLDDRNRLSAHDLTVITRAALSDATFAAIAARPSVDLPDVGTVTSRNELLGTYPGAIGVKTGYTAAAGRCLVAAAVRDGRRLLAVVLGSDGPQGHFHDARALLDHGFAAFADVQVTPRIELRAPGQWVTLASDPVVVLAPASHAVVAQTVQPPVEVATAPRATARLTWRDAEVGRVELHGRRSLTRDVHGGAAVGAWLADRAYAAMRAVTAEGRWPPGTSPM
ncbi:MAG: D-alanyl-D-alanine carboxypeptidase [Actinomycetota bacterium]|nr:D-alanyl-D-alanine carboxypeptidase [Actinomycetota bacterium]